MSAALLFLALAANFSSELVFPPEKLHNHSSSVVELPNGDLFATWYRGSGERTADDVQLFASRLKRGSRQWTNPYVIADTPNFPDCNPILFVDSKERLWLMWPIIVANRWETALLQYKISSKGWSSDPVRFDISEPLLFAPRNFELRAKAGIERILARHPSISPAMKKEIDRVYSSAGDKYAMRMGWMPRTHPLELPSGRILFPLYSDAYNFSLIAITDDGGRTWTTSEPIVSEAGVQPSLVRRRDGTLVAYMRDNGPAPKRVQVAESKDDGITWSDAVDTGIPNPGSSVEAIALKDGTWLMVLNDTERGRNSLAAWLSADEGRTWNWKRHIENGAEGSYHYPSVIQARDGSIHVTYSYFVKDGKSIKHARFDAEWVKSAPRT